MGTKKGIKGKLARSGEEERRTPIVRWGQGKARWHRKGVRSVGARKPMRANARKGSFVCASERAICQASVGTLRARKKWLVLPTPAMERAGEMVGELAEAVGAEAEVPVIPSQGRHLK